MKKQTFMFLLFLFFALLFTTCKKYPEDIYWGNPTKLENCPFHGKLTKYMVNGIDSLDLLDKYLDSSYVANYTSANASSPHVKDNEFRFSMPFHDQLIMYFGDLAMVGYTFSKNKKKITVWFDNNSSGNLYIGIVYILRKDIFISRNTEWDIVRLSHNDKPFKLKTTLSNGNSYEIQIR